MANMASNNKNNGDSSAYKNTFVVEGGGAGGNKNSNEGYNRVVDSGITTIREACNFLQAPVIVTDPNACPYDQIIEMIRGLDLQDDGILMNHKIKAIETGFCNIVLDENMLCDSMEYINNKALGDGETALKFALLFSSRNFDVLAMKETKVRSAMLKILETNFINADTYRVQDRNRLYNSITLLGEYYHRVRLADNSPITILGESLLGLLTREISDLDAIDAKLAKLILSQITLNGDIMRGKHTAELTQLLYHIRRNLIEQTDLTPAVKALLLMTLDLYYSNFANLGVQLEKMYTRYLVFDEDEGNNNAFSSSLPSPSANPKYRSPLQESILKQQPQHPSQSKDYRSVGERELTETHSNVHNSSQENGESATTNDSFEPQLSTKKWSEQVCEDAFYELELYNATSKGSESGNTKEREQQQSSSKAQQHVSTESDHLNRNSKRSYKPRNSPRAPKQNLDLNAGHAVQQQAGGEERDQTKPLPRWRATRFNRESGEDVRQRNPFRRFSASFDDDKHSVHSEGGSIRLYSVNDRLKHAQDKIERSGTNNYNSIANSNWDRQSQHDDRSERSYISNYERGNSYRRGGRNYNNRPTYDKPPRFQKHQNSKDQIIHSDSWRRSQANSNTSHHEDDGHLAHFANGPESNSRSSSRARTLPRPTKSNFEGRTQTESNAGNHRGSQSPTHGQYERSPNVGARNSNARYSSQSSLASEASGNFERRNNQRNRNFGRFPQKQHEQPQKQSGWKKSQRTTDEAKQASNWDTSKDNNSELVRNAQQTTKYMNYLSSQK